MIDCDLNPTCLICDGCGIHVINITIAILFIQDELLLKDNELNKPFVVVFVFVFSFGNCGYNYHITYHIPTQISPFLFPF